MKAIDFLRANEHHSAGTFMAEAQYLKDNWHWLKYSYAIALKVAGRMADLGWTQKQLAEAMGCSQQHVSSLLNGKVNMTLETISKLESALQLDLIGDSLVAFSESPCPLPVLNEPMPDEEPVTHTSHLVEGYVSRKKKGPKTIK